MTSMASTIDVDTLKSGPKVQRSRAPRPGSLRASTIESRLTPQEMVTSSQSSIEGQWRSAFEAAASYDKGVRARFPSDESNRNWLFRAQERLARLASEPAAVQPVPAVIESVRSLLSLLFLLGMKPSRIVTTAEGGVSLWFVRERYKALLEISNDSPGLVVLAETARGYEPHITEIPLVPGSREILRTMKRIFFSLVV